MFYLQNNTWLLDNQYYGVYRNIKDHPERFTGIKQYHGKENSVRTLGPHIKFRGDQSATDDQCIAAAKHLCSINDNIIPATKWLLKNGYAWFSRALKERPHLFAGLKQQYYKNTRTLGEIL